jgi:hypothetical protein
MTRARGNWLRSLLTGLGILAAPACTSTVWAQGFGPDPFRPYNAQYDPFTYPTGADPAASAEMAGSGVRGANQFQNYLNELQGAGRQGAEKYGIGLPYYRSAIDPRFDPKGDREYRPNKRTERSFEQTQELITQKYFAYFTETDPKKRADLLRDYNQLRSKLSRALSTRRGNPTRILEAATRAVSERRTTPEAGGRAEASPAAADSKPRSSLIPRPAFPGLRSRLSDVPGVGDSRSIPPPPPLLPGDSIRGNSGRRSPSDVLNRSRRFSPGDRAPSSPSRPMPGTSRLDRRSTPAPPPLDDR